MSTFMAVLSFVAPSARRACDAAAIYVEAILAMRVLVADDSPIVRHAIADLLRAADIMTVIRATDGDEAVRLAAEGHPDASFSITTCRGRMASRRRGRTIEAVRFGSTCVSPGAACALYERYLPSARLA